MNDSNAAIFMRLSGIRKNLIYKYPFFGRLLLRLRFGFAECGTAYTDMRNIVFDPAFAKRLTDEELEFVLLHEVYHCVLKHCIRGLSLHPLLYNIACDIVVNSLIMETLGAASMSVDSHPVMHLAPNGKEGREYTAEQVYFMFITKFEDKIALYSDKSIDTHSVWSHLKEKQLSSVWDKAISDTKKSCGNGTGIPESLERYLAEVEHTPLENWRQLLHDFIQNNRCDYSFSVPDKRFQGDIIMPSFYETDLGGSVENLWFLVDTSGSVSPEELTCAFKEIRAASEQMDNLSGSLSFFDTEVSEPIRFDTIDDLENIRPVGGGGTSFHAVFSAAKTFFENCPPRAIIIITDGHAAFPDEEATHGIPVFWIITDKKIESPWGITVHISGAE